MPLDIFDLEDVFSDLFSSVESVLGGVVFLIVSMYIILALVFIVVYFFRGYTLLSIGRKMGISSEYEWMPFVPFGQAAYRQRLLGEPDLKLLFWTDHLFYAVSFGIFLLILGVPFGTALALFALLYIGLGRLAALLLWFVTTVVVLSIPGASAGLGIYSVIIFLYMIATFVYRVTYTRRLYRKFDINPMFALHLLIPYGGIVATVFEYLIAYTSHYRVAAKKQEPVRGGAYQKDRGVYAPAVGSIIGVSGMYKDSTISIPADEEIIIGRDSALSHVIVDRDTEKVSRKHCGIRFNPTDGMYSVTDYSTNGTFREDGSRLLSNIPVTMPRGAIIIIGSRLTTFRLG